MSELSKEQSAMVQDIVRLIRPRERAGFLDMLAHELRGQDLTDEKLRRIAAQTWRRFLVWGWAGSQGSADSAA
jgi:hypothetical protein